MAKPTIELYYAPGSSVDLGYIITLAKDNWGDDLDLDHLNMEIEERKVRGCHCCYDASDYDQYLIITYNY